MLVMQHFLKACSSISLGLSSPNTLSACFDSHGQEMTTMSQLLPGWNDFKTHLDFRDVTMLKKKSAS